MPEFGPYLKEKEERIANYKKTIGPLKEFLPESHRPPYKPTKPIPAVKVSQSINHVQMYLSLQDVIGCALPRIGAWGQLDGQAVAIIDEDMCINCGKCYMVCNDSGYQAITFDPDTHLPHITEECTGCTLCVSVCPIIDCIKMVDRDTPYNPRRGIPLEVASVIAN